MARSTTTSEYKNLWHVGNGFGNTMAEGTTVEQGMALAGLDREVIKRPVMAVIDDGTQVAIPGKAATIEVEVDAKGKETHRTLGVVGDGYSVCQNANAFVIPMVLEDQGKFTLQSIGRFKNGARTMITGNVSDHSIIRLDGSEDRVSSQFVFSNGHDGKHSVVGGFTHMRHICSNQNDAIMRGLKSEIRLSHTGNVESRLAEAASFLFEAEQEMSLARDVFQSMAETRMTVRQYRNFAAKLLDSVKGSHDENDGTKDARESKEARDRTIEELVTYFGEGAGNTGESQWDAFNSITEWLDHKVERLEGSKQTAKRFESQAFNTAFGRNRRVKGRALQILRS